jgi:hypothetical protein
MKFIVTAIPSHQLEITHSPNICQGLSWGTWQEEVIVTDGVVKRSGGRRKFSALGDTEALSLIAIKGNNK